MGVLTDSGDIDLLTIQVINNVTHAPCFLPENNGFSETRNLYAPAVSKYVLLAELMKAELNF